MMDLKRTGLLLMSLILLFSLVLSACSSSESDSNVSQGSNAENAEDTGNKDESGEGREHLELSLFLEGEANAVLPKGDDDFVRKRIEEKFNVTLDVDQLPMGDNLKQKMSLLISSGDTPDLFLVDGRTSGDYHRMGILADLSEYVTPEKMPNLFQWVTQEEVEAFQYPGSFDRGPRPVESNHQFSYFIRKDWVDNLGLEMPTNYKELTAVMEAFTYDDPDGNGKDDTYGISMPGGGKNVYYGFPQFRKHDLIGATFVDENNDFHDSESDLKTGEVIDDVREWIEAGVVDPDWFLSETADVGEKFSQGRIGMVWVLNLESWAFESNPNSYYSQLKNIIPEAEMVPFNPFPGTSMWVGPYMTMPWLISKSTADESPEKVERIIEILDWMASEEGYLLTHYGIEDIHYTLQGDEIHIIADAYESEIINNGNFLTIWSFLTPYEPERIGLTEIDPRITDRDREIMETVDSFPVAQGLGTAVNTPEGISIADFRAKLYEYQVQTLFEDEDSSNWPAYREELMTTYRGQEIFDEYIRQMREVGIEVNDFE